MKKSAKFFVGALAVNRERWKAQHPSLQQGKGLLAVLAGSCTFLCYKKNETKNKTKKKHFFHTHKNKMKWNNKKGVDMISAWLFTPAATKQERMCDMKRWNTRRGQEVQWTASCYVWEGRAPRAHASVHDLALAARTQPQLYSSMSLPIIYAYNVFPFSRGAHTQRSKLSRIYTYTYTAPWIHVCTSYSILMTRDFFPRDFPFCAPWKKKNTSRVRNGDEIILVSVLSLSGGKKKD